MTNYDSRDDSNTDCLLSDTEIAELEQISLKLGDIADRLLIIGRNNDFPTVAGLATATGEPPPPPRTASAARRSPSLDELAEKMMGPRPDYRHPIFRDHNCWRCDNGKNPCVRGSCSDCEFPRARND